MSIDVDATALSRLPRCEPCSHWQRFIATAAAVAGGRCGISKLFAVGKNRYGCIVQDGCRHIAVFALCVMTMVVLLGACSAPVSVERVSLRVAYQDLNRTALSSDELSETARTVLRRSALLDLFASDPDAAISSLRASAIATGMQWQDLYTLAEMHYALGVRRKSKPMLLASAIYAYAVLFPSGDADRPSPYSAQFRHSANFYNLALTQVLTSGEDEPTATLPAGRQPLPFGTLDVLVDQKGLVFSGHELTSFVPTMNLTVEGFQNDYRSDGIGAPVAAGLKPSDSPHDGLVLSPYLRIPASVVLDLDDPRRQLAGSTLAGRVTVYTIYDTEHVRIGSHQVPLEYDQTAVRALFASQARSWTRELSGLLSNSLFDPAGPGSRDHLFALEPHRHGRIPVVLIHGTASSPIRWGGMVNDLLEYKEIRDKFEFWFFTYDTGNPIPISAYLLRRSLEGAIRASGGVSSDPALGRMVLIGHSQGGLLAKMLSIETGSRIWDTISNRPLDDLPLRPETKELLRNSLFVHPLSFVGTVIFIATPHGGSYRASLTAVGIFDRLVTLPIQVAGIAADILGAAGDAFKAGKAWLSFNSVGDMSPHNPGLEAMRAIPIPSEIHTHSIIPTLQDGPLDTRDDGVVRYVSAHLEGVQSELVIEHQGHSTQSNAFAVLEVRRILLETLRRPGREPVVDAGRVVRR